MITLALDASTYEGTVAVLDGALVRATGETQMRGRDAERLMPEVEATLRRAGVTLAQVGRIACGAGPGSFTSLRIAGSLAKGMALGAAKPLFAASSLALIVAANVTNKGDYLALLDAIRGDYFAACFTFDGTNVSAAGEPMLTPRGNVEALAARLRAKAVGPDFSGNWKPSAHGVTRLEAGLSASGPVDLANWEPTYGRLPEAQLKLEAAAK